MRTTILAGVLLVAAIGALTGCATGNPSLTDESLDVYGAKATAQRIEGSLAAFVPVEAIASTEQTETGGLLSCRGERVFQWSGHTYLHLAADVDTEAIVDDVATYYRDQPGFRAERDTTDDGVPRVRVRGPHGSTYSMALSVDRTYIQILSFSPCFRLADGLHPRDTY